ncbi:MAG: DUF4040 domain-containing protein [Bdellovibrionales bacterium]|nr:DUF4040 domain-containing protein [Bdellovibrionales bacterium]
MLWLFNCVLLTLVVASAVAALSVKDLLSAVTVLSGYSFLMCLLWAELGAVDVAFTEAAVGAGVSTVFFVAAILWTTRRSSD